MKVEIGRNMSETLSEFMNRKYVERVGQHGRHYTVRQFAREIGLHEQTMINILNKRGQTERIALDTLQALVRAFGRELTDLFDISPPV